jgi:hypothetical protein
MNNIELIKIEFLALLKAKKKGYHISLQKASEWLEVPEIYENYRSDQNSRKNFRKRFLRSEKFLLTEAKAEDEFGNDFIMRKKGKNDNNLDLENNLDNDPDNDPDMKKKVKIEFPWFSTEGFKMFCMTSGGIKANYVRKYFIQIEDDYWRVLRQSKAETELEYKKLNDEIDRHKSILNKKDEGIQRAETDRDKYLMENLQLKHFEYIDDVLKTKDDILSLGNYERKELEYLRKETMKKVPIYIVNTTFVNKVKKVSKSKVKSKKVLNSDESDESCGESSHQNDIKGGESSFQSEIKGGDEAGDKFENIDYEKEFNEYHLNEVYNQEYSDDDPVMYYCLGALNGKQKPVTNHHKIGEIFIKDKEHLDKINERFNNDAMDYYGKFEYKTQRPLIWKTTYKEIMNTRSEVLQRRLSDILKNEKNLIMNHH